MMATFPLVRDMMAATRLFLICLSSSSFRIFSSASNFFCCSIFSAFKQKIALIFTHFEAFLQKKVISGNSCLTFYDILG